MMRPQLRFRMCGRAARMVWKLADRLMAMTASHRSGGKLLDRSRVLNSGIVDQDVDLAELLDGQVHHPVDLGGL